MSYKHIVKAFCYDKKGRLISEAVNNYNKTHPIQAHFANMVNQPDRVFLHAEIAAILKAKDKSIYKIRIERIGRKGTLLPSHPCPICMAAIKAFGIKQLEYTL